MKIISLTRGKSALVDDEDYDRLNQWKWHCLANGYAARKEKRQYVRMHCLINNTPKGMFTDHKNGDKLDNRKMNLRSCTKSQNMMNIGKRRHNSTGYVGVYKTTLDIVNCFRAEIRANGIKYHLGCFKTAIEAARAYDTKALEVHGEFAYTNLMSKGKP